MQEREVNAIVVEEASFIIVFKKEGGRLLHLQIGGEEQFYWFGDSVSLTVHIPHMKLLPHGPAYRELVDFWKEHHPRET